MQIVPCEDRNHNVFTFTFEKVPAPAVFMFDTNDKLLLRVQSQEEVDNLESLTRTEYTRYCNDCRMNGLRPYSQYFHKMQSMLNLARKKLDKAQELNAVIHLVVRNNNTRRYIYE